MAKKIVKKNAYEIITEKVLSDLESGIIPWKQPWIGVPGAGPKSHISGQPYSFLNAMLLGRGGEYITYKQATKEGGHVKKGAKGKKIGFYKKIARVTKESAQDKGEDVIEGVRMVPYFTTYTVFHINDCEGIEAKFPVEADLPEERFEIDDEVRQILWDYYQKYGIVVQEEVGNKAAFYPAEDKILMPDRRQFGDPSEYYSTIFHETVHSTGSKSRLNRDQTGKFGSKDYSKEELVAEIGAHALMHHFGIETPMTFENSAAYIENWIQVLSSDSKTIVQASSRAEKAVNFVLGIEEEV